VLLFAEKMFALTKRTKVVIPKSGGGGFENERDLCLLSLYEREKGTPMQMNKMYSLLKSLII
jgi:hypothetical protein